MEFFSRLIAFFLLITLAPLLMIIALCNLIIQGRPIFFTQNRVGKNFDLFKIYKFRTLRNNQANQKIFQDGSNLDATKWGRFLRRNKLDELPQLFNILKGEMRFIGPRPEVPEYVDNKSFGYLESIKPGLSGYSSIIFRNESEIWSVIDPDNSYNQILNIKVLLDNYYLTRKNFFEDLKLVVVTILSIIIPRRMGHYLIINLLKIENSDDFKIMDTISKLKIKKPKKKVSLFSNNQNKRILILSDIISIMCGFLFASIIRNDFLIPQIIYDDSFYNILSLVLIAKLFSFYIFGMFKGMWRYTSLIDMVNIVKANVFGTILFVAIIGYSRGFIGIPRSVFMIDC